MKHSYELRVRSWESKRKTSNAELQTPNSHGFTLLEVMVAVSIMATVLVILLGLQSRTMQDVAQAEHITTATLLAKRMMVDVIVSKNWLPVEEAGDFKDEDKFKDYTWKKTLSQIPLFGTVFITEIRIAVLWKEGTRAELVELVDYE
jgi:prepilin-type N-terminal cleavage/methylation domain-containing protein